VSKHKDKQKNEPSTGAGAVRHVHEQIAQMDDAALAATVDAVETRDAVRSMGSEARIQHLEAEVARHGAETAMLKKDLSEVRDHMEMARHDLGVLSKAARHGAPPEGFEPKTAEGREALEDVVRLGRIAQEQRDRANEEYRLASDAKRELEKVVVERKAIHSDLMAIEQTASGGGVRNIPQTELGRSALNAVDEVLDALHKAKDAGLEGDALPAKGWSSDTARQLVEAVGPQPGLRASDARSLLLGDLLALLLPHTGEQGQNETASDVVRRIINDLELHKTSLTRAHADLQTRARQIDELSERMVKIQSAMVARRAPDAEAGSLLEALGVGLTMVAKDMGITSSVPIQILPIFERMRHEWRGLREFFSEAPFTAVAVRDDGHKGPVRERFSLLVLDWDGKAVKTQVVEAVRPWGDISPYLEQTTRKHLIPAAYR
jgi:hypothetical protein